MDTVTEIAIVGGSIAGSAAASVLARAGVPATIFEGRSTMRDGGYGVCLPAAVLEQARARGLIDDSLRTIPLSHRHWVTADHTRASRTLWRQSFPAPVHALRWGDLWQALRQGMPSDARVDHRAVAAAAAAGDEIELGLADGGAARFRGVVGADGVGSVVRRDLFETARPHPAGYAHWRGTIDVLELGRLPEALHTAGAVTVGFQGGHLVAYLIPGEGDGVLVNWVLYAAGDDDTYARATAALPLEWAELLARTAHVARRSVGDLQPERTVAGGALLVGDAAAITRPHTASGAAKALEDAFALDDALARCDSWSDTIDRVDRIRGRATRNLVELGRRIGRDQVEHTPPWSEMTPETMADWASATISGDTSYLYRPAGAGEPRTAGAVGDFR